MRKINLPFCAPLLFACWAHADSLTVTMHEVTASEVGAAIGTVTVMDSRNGAIFKPWMSDLSPGFHGFHVHQNPSCEPAEKDGKKVAGLAAGGHYDPADTGIHAGPYEGGHLGDLPALYVDAQGKAKNAIIAPRITVADVRGRALMIHAGGDNYSDKPKKLGGGGARMACGVFN